MKAELVIGNILDQEVEVIVITAPTNYVNSWKI